MPPTPRTPAGPRVAANLDLLQGLAFPRHTAEVSVYPTLRIDLHPEHNAAAALFWAVDTLTNARIEASAGRVGRLGNWQVTIDVHGQWRGRDVHVRSSEIRYAGPSFLELHRLAVAIWGPKPSESEATGEATQLTEEKLVQVAGYTATEKDGRIPTTVVEMVAAANNLTERQLAAVGQYADLPVNNAYNGLITWAEQNELLHLADRVMTHVRESLWSTPPGQLTWNASRIAYAALAVALRPFGAPGELCDTAQAAWLSGLNAPAGRVECAEQA